MGLFSSIGGVLGTLAGVALAPATGGASLAIPLAGGALGGAAGAAIDGNRANKKAEGYYNQQMDFAKSQDQFQRDYVHNAMQWRIEDAKQAGVHPMAALGFQSPNYSPVSTPSAPSYMDSSNFDTGSTFGQTFNNAVFAAKTQQQQLEAGQLSNRGLELQNQHMELTNLQLASELQRASMTTKAKPDVNGQGSLGVIGGQQDAVSPDASATVRSSSPDAVSLMVPVVSGDFVIPVYNPNIADPLSESIHNSTTAKLNYMDAVSRGDILAPPRSSWSKEQARKVDAGTHRWKFDAAAWRWSLEPNVAYSRDRLSASGRIMPYRYYEMYK